MNSRQQTICSPSSSSPTDLTHLVPRMKLGNLDNTGCARRAGGLIPKDEEYVPVPPQARKRMEDGDVDAMRYKGGSGTRVSGARMSGEDDEMNAAAAAMHKRAEAGSPTVAGYRDSATTTWPKRDDEAKMSPAPQMAGLRDSWRWPYGGGAATRGPNEDDEEKASQVEVTSSSGNGYLSGPGARMPDQGEAAAAMHKRVDAEDADAKGYGRMAGARVMNEEEKAY